MPLPSLLEPAAMYTTCMQPIEMYVAQHILDQCNTSFIGHPLLASFHAIVHKPFCPCLGMPL